MNLQKLVALPGVFLLSCCVSCQNQATTRYTNAIHDYSIGIPGGWEKIPSEKLNEKAKEIGTNYDVGLYPKRKGYIDDWGYPYILIGFTGGNISPSSYDEVAESIVKKWGSSEVLKVINGGVSMRFQDFKVGVPYYDKTHSCVLMAYRSNIDGQVDMMAVACMYLTPIGLLGIYLYDLNDSTPKTFNDVLVPMLSTLK